MQMNKRGRAGGGCFGEAYLHRVSEGNVEITNIEHLSISSGFLSVFLKIYLVCLYSIALASTNFIKSFKDPDSLGR